MQGAALHPPRGYIPCTPKQMKPFSWSGIGGTNTCAAKNFIPSGSHRKFLRCRCLQTSSAAEILDISRGAAAHRPRIRRCAQSSIRQQTNAAIFDSGTESGDISESRNKPIEFIGFKLTIRRPQTSVLQSSALRLRKMGLGREPCSLPSRGQESSRG